MPHCAAFPRGAEDVTVGAGESARRLARATAAEHAIAEREGQAVGLPIATRAGSRCVGRDADEHGGPIELQASLAVAAGTELRLVEHQLAVVAVARRHQSFPTPEADLGNPVHV